MAGSDQQLLKSAEAVLARCGLQGRRVLVVGLGLTGLSVVRFLEWLNVSFEIADDYIDDQRLQETLGKHRNVANRKLHREFSDELFRQFDVLIVSPGVPLANPAFLAARAAGVDVLGDIALFARICDASLIAVTGSNGKSTVVAWLAHVLAGSELSVELGGNIGKPVLDLVVEGSLDCDVVVLELSSFQLELAAELPVLGATVLNISEDHLDRYESIEAYAGVKAGIYNTAQYCVLNAQDLSAWPQQLPPGANCAVFSSASAEKQDISQELQKRQQGPEPVVFTCVSVQAFEGEDWLMVNDDALLPVANIALAGQHNVDNALAVIALLQPFELPVAVIRQYLPSFSGLPHRMQLVAEIEGVRWFNDSKGTNVDACVKAITGIGAPVVLIAGGLGKGADFTALREPVADCVKAVVLFGADADQLKQALSDLVACHAASDMQDAVRQASLIAGPGDVVLLSPACASFDMFQSFEHRGEVFMDKVRSLAA